MDTQENQLTKVVNLLKQNARDFRLSSAIEQKLPVPSLVYLSFRWKDDVHEAGVTGLDLHRRLRFETWLLGGAFFLQDAALEGELYFLHSLALTIRGMLSNPKDEE